MFGSTTAPTRPVLGKEAPSAQEAVEGGEERELLVEISRTGVWSPQAPLGGRGRPRACPASLRRRCRSLSAGRPRRRSRVSRPRPRAHGRRWRLRLDRRACVAHSSELDVKEGAGAGTEPLCWRGEQVHASSPAMYCQKRSTARESPPSSIDCRTTARKGDRIASKSSRSAYTSRTATAHDRGLAGQHPESEVPAAARAEDGRRTAITVKEPAASSACSWGDVVVHPVGTDSARSRADRGADGNCRRQDPPGVEMTAVTCPAHDEEHWRPAAADLVVLGPVNRHPGVASLLVASTTCSPDSRTGASTVYEVAVART